MNDKEFFERHPKASFAEFMQYAWHEKVHSNFNNPNCYYCSTNKE